MRDLRLWCRLGDTSLRVSAFHTHSCFSTTLPSISSWNLPQLCLLSGQSSWLGSLLLIYNDSPHFQINLYFHEAFLNHFWQKGGFPSFLPWRAYPYLELAQAYVCLSFPSLLLEASAVHLWLFRCMKKNFWESLWKNELLKWALCEELQNWWTISIKCVLGQGSTSRKICYLIWGKKTTY